MDMREVFTIDGRRFSNMAGFYDEVERVFTFGLDRKIGRNQIGRASCRERV